MLHRQGDREISIKLYKGIHKELNIPTSIPKGFLLLLSLYLFYNASLTEIPRVNKLVIGYIDDTKSNTEIKILHVKADDYKTGGSVTTRSGH